MFNNKFIKQTNFDIFSITCDEKIQKKNIKNFILTNLKLQTTIQKNYLYFYHWCEVLNQYQIYKTKNMLLSNINIEPLLFGLVFVDKSYDKQQNYLFETDEYFVLYISSDIEFVFIKDNSTTKDTIVEYLSQHGIDIDKTIFMTNNQMYELEIQFNKHKKNFKELPYIQQSQRYLVFVISALLILFIYLNKDQAVQKVQQQLNIKPIIKAIINNEALIENSWYKIDGIYKGYKIINIKNNEVVFLINNKTITAKIVDENR